MIFWLKLLEFILKRRIGDFTTTKATTASIVEGVFSIDVILALAIRLRILFLRIKLDLTGTLVNILVLRLI